jgi:hypothetical protein
MQATYVLGLDVGPPGEPTGFAILERPAYEKPPREPEYHLRHAERFTPGSSYPAIIGGVVERAKSAGISGCPLIVDQTAVGLTFVRQLQKAQSDLYVVSIAVTAGQAVQKAEDGTEMVPKRDLVMALQMALQTRQLKIAPELPEAPLLMTELAGFRLHSVPISETATIEWREGRHDDLVFAVALAVWYAERHPPLGPDSIRSGGGLRFPKGLFLTDDSGFDD